MRALLAPRTPPPAVEALLLSALALLWPDDAPPYADHTLVDQAVTAARKRAPQSASFLNAVLRRFLRERDALVAAALKQPTAQLEPSAVVDRPPEGRLAGALAAASWPRRRSVRRCACA